MAQAPIQWQVIEDAIHAWFSGATSLTTVWGRANAPQPQYPYGVLVLVSGPLAPGGADERRTSTNLNRVGSEVEIATVGLRELTISCQVLQGPTNTFEPAQHAMHYIGAAQASLSTISVLEAFRAAGVSVIDHGDVTILDEVVDSAWIQRANLDVRFGISSNAREYVGYIEKFEATSQTFGFTDRIFGVGG